MTPAKTTVADFLERWLQDYCKTNLSPRSFEGYEYIMHRYLIPALGVILLTGLKPEHLQKYYSEQQTSGLSAQTIRHHHTDLHKALQTATEWGLLSRNVADAVKPPRVQQMQMQTWNEDELTRFLEAAKDSP